jgi:hypothetical protein
MKHARLAIFGSLGIWLFGMLTDKSAWDLFTYAYWYGCGIGAAWWQFGRATSSAPATPPG